MELRGDDDEAQSRNSAEEHGSRASDGPKKRRRRTGGLWLEGDLREMAVRAESIAAADEGQRALLELRQWWSMETGGTDMTAPPPAGKKTASGD
ncbi:hypothetical protein CDD83_2078 [Cordyceps sp. RAO-2017]|nr:hypothetical protein CDD83_2078 [Cordyceps sp. RAO-2017]